MKLEDLGEFGFIEFLKGYSRCDIGDDCAVLDVGCGKEMLLTTDAMVEGVHFFSDTDFYLLGRKALAVNLSDIAACGGKPRWALLDLCVNGNMGFDGVKSFMDGFFEIAEEFGVTVVGGDTVGNDRFSVAVTLVGENERGKSIMRSGARPGDDVYVSGEIGCSYAGFIALKRGMGSEYARFVESHLNPVPKVELGMRLRGIATAMIDVSDGMIQDCEHICESSGVGIKLYLEKIPLCEADYIAVEDKLTGGEDYELLFCASSRYREMLLSMGCVTLVGEVVEGSGVAVCEGNRRLEIGKKGFSHF